MRTRYIIALRRDNAAVACFVLSILLAPSVYAACNRGGAYMSRDGHEVPSPRCVDSDISAAAYLCSDGSFSYAEHRQGACSRHGGILRVLGGRQ